MSILEGTIADSRAGSLKPHRSGFHLLFVFLPIQVYFPIAMKVIPVSSDSVNSSKFFGACYVH